MYGIAWTEDDIACLRDLCAKGFKRAKIARIMRRTSRSIHHAMAKHVPDRVPQRVGRPRRAAAPKVAIDFAGYPREVVAWAVQNRAGDPQARLIAGIVAEANRRIAA